jgi:hypothetical protein
MAITIERTASVAMRSKSIIGPALNHTRSNLVNGGKSTRGAPEILFLRLFATSVQRNDLAVLSHSFDCRPTPLIRGGPVGRHILERLILASSFWYRSNRPSCFIMSSADNACTGLVE